MKKFTLLILLFGIASCGFNLRGSYTVPQDLRNMCLDAEAAPELGRELAMRLQRSQVNLSNDKRDCVKLTIESVDLQRSVLSLFPNAQVAEYELDYRVRYQLVFVDGKVNSYTTEVVRDYQDDPDAVMAKSKEMDILKAELRRYAAEQIVLRLSSVGVR
ncbi:LPS assembly lipoprotein LptE [Gayadomonas joobiniege]|uniref:LPS-assembly lipoprotein LptE n=1 Tax=Gayadomonas joobiniege TaxID=1234606 RepID=UPI00037B89D2|nr:LPS assembly lipoprotein LptE [Gayadomonas joobiniege]